MSKWPQTYTTFADQFSKPRTEDEVKLEESSLHCRLLSQLADANSGQLTKEDIQTYFRKHHFLTTLSTKTALPGRNKNVIRSV